MPGGCERQGPTVDQSWSPAAPSVSGVPDIREVAIRVFLDRVKQLRIDCPEHSYSIWAQPGEKEILTLPAGQPCWLRRDGGSWRLELPDGKDIPNQPAAQVEVRPSPNQILTIGTDPPRRYRGRLLCLSESTDRFAVVNVLDLEEYLAGVVGAEMYAGWHGAALRAQSIAARTYALYQMHRRFESRGWDIGSSQASQMYSGLASENPHVSRAVADTRGIVLTWGQPGREKIFPAFYGSICGGHTQDAEEVFRHSLSPLRGRTCAYCQSIAPANRYQWPRVRISKKQASELLLERYPMLVQLERIAGVKIVQKSDYGRIEVIKLTGSNGKSLRIRAEDFRLAVGSKKLLSSWYDLTDAGDVWQFDNGRGWGHGVGLCQYGSQAMARQGKDCLAILNYYYPQAVLLRAY